MSGMSEVRPSPIAGSWYEGNPAALARAVDGSIHAAQLPEFAGEVVAVIAPHAGHRYSGPVAGYAFAAIKGASPSVVAIISPMHHYYQHHLLTSAHAAYGTPLGEIPVNHL